MIFKRSHPTLDLTKKESATVKRSRAVLPPTQPISTHTISVQSAKPSHAYPIIRLPRAFHALAGSKAAIYQTVHDGKLAFLVTVLDHPEEKLKTGSNNQKKSIKGGAKLSSLEGPHLCSSSPNYKEALP